MQKIYTTKYINIISFVITVITFLIINIICNLAKNPSIFQTGLKDTVKIEFDDNSENQNSSSKEEVIRFSPGGCGYPGTIRNIFPKRRKVV